MHLFSRTAELPAIAGLTYWQRRLLEECQRSARHGHGFIVATVLADAGDVLHAPIAGSGGRVVLLRPRNEAPAGQSAGTLSKEELAVIVGALRHAVRGSDVVCRLAPARFGLLLLETTAEYAYPTCIRLLGQVRAEVAGRVPSLQGFGLHFGYAAFGGELTSPTALGVAAERDLRRRWARDADDAGA